MTYVALLRGINVGGNNKIEMTRLKQTFERLGFSDVKTVIASGNVLFKTDQIDKHLIVKKIESGIEKDFGVSVKILLRDLENMQKLVKAIPTSWVNDNAVKCDVMFLFAQVDNKRTLSQLPFNKKIEDVKYVPGAVLWRIDRSKVLKSRMFKIASTKLYQQMTIRNPNTVRKLYDLMREISKNN